MAQAAAQGTRTQVLDILVTKQSDGNLGSEMQAGLGACAESLVDDDTVGDGGRDEGCAVVELGSPGPPVRTDP